MKKFLLIGLVACGLAGCAGLSTAPTTAKTAGSVCAGAGAAMAALALQGTPAEQAQALKDAAVLTPACSATSPANAVTASIQSAATALTTLAAPYQIGPTTMGAKLP